MRSSGTSSRRADRWCSIERRLTAINKLLPSAITAVRLGLVPLLAVLVGGGMLFYGAALFLVLLFTDFLDGHLARKHGACTKFGTYFDATTDFVLVLSLFLTFGPEGFYAWWIPFLVAAVFAMFVITGIASGRIYDPVGKYYGSLLYGATGLRFIFSGEIFCIVVTSGIVVFSVASILSRAAFFIKKRDAEVPVPLSPPFAGSNRLFRGRG